MNPALAARVRQLAAHRRAIAESRAPPHRRPAGLHQRAAARSDRHARQADRHAVNLNHQQLTGHAAKPATPAIHAKPTNAGTWDCGSWSDGCVADQQVGYRPGLGPGQQLWACGGQAFAKGDGRGLGAAPGAELGQDVRDVDAGLLAEMNSSAAISRLLRPATTRRRTSISRAVRPRIPAGGPVRWRGWQAEAGPR